MSPRLRKLRAAGTPIHAHARAAGVYYRAYIAECGAQGRDGAEFTTWSKHVTCPECRAVIVARRRLAKERAAALGLT